MNPDVKTIEIDVDGVLADLFGNKELKKMLKNAYPGWKAEHIKEYNFAHLKQTHPEAYTIIFNSFNDDFTKFVCSCFYPIFYTLRNIVFCKFFQRFNNLFS